MALEQGREATSSIELQRAKDGTYYWTIKRYVDMNGPTESQAAIAEINAIDSALRAQYLDAHS